MSVKLYSLMFEMNMNCYTNCIKNFLPRIIPNSEQALKNIFQFNFFETPWGKHRYKIKGESQIGKQNDWVSLNMSIIFN